MKKRSWDNDEINRRIVQAIRRFYRQSGCSPTAATWRKSRLQPSAHMILKHFGKWNDALRASNIPRSKEQGLRLSRKEVLRDAKRVLREQGQLTYNIYKKHGKYAISTVERQIGSFSSIQKELGLSPRLSYEGSSDEQILCILKKWIKKNQRVPRSGDFGKGELPSAQVYQKRFGGSFEVAIRLAGETPSTFRTYTDSELLEYLHDYCQQMNRDPKLSDFYLGGPGLPSRGHMRRRFGSIRNALAKAGVNIIDDVDFLHWFKWQRLCEDVVHYIYPKCRIVTQGDHGCVRYGLE